MDLESDDELRAFFRRGIEPLLPADGFGPRVWSRLRERIRRPARRSARLLLSVSISVVLVAALAGGFALTRGIGTRTTSPVIRALTAGAPANPEPDASSHFVWWTGSTAEALTVETPCPSSVATAASPLPSGVTLTCWTYPGSGNFASVTYTCATPSPSPASPSPCDSMAIAGGGSTYIRNRVDVLDWTGALRYHFTLPTLPSHQGATDALVAVSPDGTRAVLADGTVIDETGRAVAKVVPLAYPGPDLPVSGSLGILGIGWASDDSGLCLAGPPEVLSDPQGWSESVAANPLQQNVPFTTLEVEFLPLHGAARTLSAIPLGQAASNGIADAAQTTVDACDPETGDVVVSLAPPTDSSVPGAQEAWVLRLSTGAVVTRIQTALPAEPGAWSVTTGSVDGSLLGQTLPAMGASDRAAGCSSIAGLHLPSGDSVPGLESLTCPYLLGLSADGSRLLISNTDIVERGHPWTPGTKTTFELVDTATGAVVRSVTVPGNFSATAVASPTGQHFMLVVDGHLLLVDGQGGISQLPVAPGMDLSGDATSFSMG